MTIFALGTLTSGRCSYGADMFTYDDILTPLALTVIIDNKVRDPEMNEYFRQANSLIELFGLEPMSAEAAVKWFETNEPILSSELVGKRRNTVVLRALTRFKDDIHVENLYEAMLAISVSDKEYVVQESELIKSAAAIWGYQRPPFKVNKRND